MACEIISAALINQQDRLWFDCGEQRAVMGSCISEAIGKTADAILFPHVHRGMSEIRAVISEELFVGAGS